MTRRILAAVIFLSLAIPTAPALLRLVREAAALRKLPMRERRVHVMGDFYRGTMRVFAAMSAPEPLALVPRNHGESDLATFFNYYAYPRPTRMYRGLETYALAGGDATRPATIVGFAPAPHLTMYAALRAQSIVGQPLVRGLTPAPIATREFVVPFVCSVDGPPPNTYTVEATFAADAATNVDVTWFPSGATRRFLIHGTRPVADLAYETSSQMGVGWIRVTSDAPIRAAFALVNRGTRAATLLPIVTALPPLPLRFPPRPDARLWLVNVHDETLIATAGGVQARMPPHAIVPMGPEVIVTAPKPIFAFLSEKDANGGTHFTWPEGWP